MRSQATLSSESVRKSGYKAVRFSMDSVVESNELPDTALPPLLLLVVLDRLPVLG